MGSQFNTFSHGEIKDIDLDNLWFWIKRTPECVGILKRICTDIFTEIEFTPYDIEVRSSGRPKNDGLLRVNRAKSFWRRNSGKQKMYNAGFDWLGTGDAYLWKGMVQDQLKEFVGLAVETKSTDFYDEDYNSLNSIEVVPSSMTTIHHDDFKIISYIQKSKVNPSMKKTFFPDEILHAKLMDIDGSVYGFTPFISALYAIKTINAIQDYGYNYFANGAKLDYAFKFMGNVNPTYIDKVEEQIKQYTNVSNAHGSLILEGADKIEIEKLNDVSEEMEYRQLAIHCVGRLAFSFNMPADILSSILGVDIKGSAGSSDIENSGYNRNIIECQKYWEDLLNSQLFIPYFKVEGHFERTFKQDAIRDVQRMAQAAQVAEFFMRHKFPVVDDFYIEFMGIPKKFLTDGEIDKDAQPVGMLSGAVPKGNEQRSATKKSEQKPQQSNNKPIGS
uniref:Putative portal protein n=1 Tax=viral metagenome TaxID=1070528 RepID=A0A6M3LGR9_9ZZZZ